MLDNYLEYKVLNVQKLKLSHQSQDHASKIWTKEGQINLVMKKEFAIRYRSRHQGKQEP